MAAHGQGGFWKASSPVPILPGPLLLKRVMVWVWGPAFLLTNWTLGSSPHSPRSPPDSQEMSLVPILGDLPDPVTQAPLCEGVRALSSAGN